MDRVDKNTRHSIMSANRGKNTSPEIEVRRALFNYGFRFRIHVSDMPGRPDIVLPRHRTVVFMHGCFWHGHECNRRPKSKSNRKFWQEKIARNRSRDLAVRNKLLEASWRILVIWECAIRRQSPAFGNSSSLKKIIKWIVAGVGRLAILSESNFEECL